VTRPVDLKLLEKMRASCVSALTFHFKHMRRPEVVKCVWARGTDPGGWSPDAILTVHLESGLPDVFTYPYTSGAWDKVEDYLSEAYGKPVFFESINSAVTALWEV